MRRRARSVSALIGFIVVGLACAGNAFASSASPNPVSFGNVPINTTVSSTVTITVDSGFRTEVASGSGLNAPFAFDFGSCGTGGGFTGPGTCTVTERYTPTAVAPNSGTTNVFECPVAGGSCVGIPFDVSGAGVSVASASPNPVGFGNVPINTTVTTSVTVNVDAGYRTEVASGSGLNAPFGFDFGSCGAGGGFTGPGTCTVSERYSPTATGAASGTTNVFECPVVGGTCIGIPFNESGNGVSQASASPNPVSFGNVPINTTATSTVTIHVDAGYRTEVASGSGLNAPFAFDFDTCGTGGGFTGPGTCTVTERYTPTATGAASGTTNVFECPVVGGTCIGIPFNENGNGVRQASASPNPVSFGDVPINTTASASVTIHVDAGYRTEVASGSGLNAPFAFDFNTCGTGGGFTGPGTCTVTERYTPTAVTPSSATTNVFECPVVGGTCIGIPFNESGNGVSQASASPNPVSFGDVPINTTVSAPVTIHVDAGYRTEVTSGSGLNAPFAFDFNTCGTGGGFTGPGTCTVTERYTPTATGAASGTTNVFECPVVGGTCIGIPFNESSNGVSQASASPNPVSFGDVPINTTVSAPVTIHVDAGYRTEVASGSGLNAPFAFDFNTCGTGGGFTGQGTCTVTERYTPTAVGPNNGTTNVFECPVVGGTCIGIPFNESGNGVSQASASPNPVSFGDVPINTTASASVTIHVDAGYRTEVASGSGLNAPFAFDFNTCGTGGGFTGPGTCSVTERYTPTAVGPNSGTTNVFECPVVGGTCIGIPFNVQGNGVSVASANPNPVSFGNVPINTTVSQAVTITVDAGYSAELASGSGINLPFHFDFGTCSGAGAGTCTVNESYTPTATGAASGTTNVFECPIAGGVCIGIPFNVSGTGVSVASASPNPVSFGNVPLNTTVSHAVSITVDAGYSPELASGSGINLPFHFDFGTCSGAGAGTCTVNESFTPTALGGASGTTNVFECPVAGGTCLPIPFNVSGTGVSVASASPNPVSFGNVPLNTTVSHAVSITVDAGYSPELASGSGINLPFHFDFGTCSGAGAGTCTVNESFTPTALGGASGTTNVFECPVAGGTCLPIPFDVSGTGVSVAAASPSTVDFGQVSLGATKTTPVTITADTGYTVQLASGSGINPPFSFAFGTCSSFAGPGNCIVQETFAPTAVGPANGTLNVFECPTAGGTCIGIPVSVTGIGVLNTTSTKIASSQNPSKVGQPVTFTATVTAATGPTPITGNVTFSDGSTVLGTVALASNGKASLTTSSLAFGSHTITAAYAGDSAHGTSSASLTQTVQRLRSSTSLRSSDGNSTVGEAVTFTATVSGPGGTPTGTVTFTDGSTALGTVSLSGGRASLTTSALAHGHHDITGTYNGDATYAPSSDDVNQHVQRNDSNTSLKSSANPSSAGQAVTFTATVTASGPTPTGTVTFTDGSLALGTVTLSGGTASLTTSTLSTGGHHIRASYSGSDSDRSSSDSVTQVVRGRR